MLSLKKLRNALRKELSMREFFTSPVFRKNFEDVSKMVSARYETPIFIKLEWDTRKNDIAYTDNRLIYINLDNSLVCNIDNLEDRYLAYLGLLGHELGHVLHTNFECGPMWINSLISGKIYGDYDAVYKKNADDFLDYMSKTKFYNYAFEIFRGLSNSIEDRFVNEEICKEFSGTFNTGIKKLHKIQYAEPIKLLYNPITDFMNAVLSISILNEIPEGFEKQYPQLKKIKEILKDIPKFKDFNERLKLSNNVFLEYWPVIKAYAELHKEEAENSNGSESGNGGSQSQKSGSSNSSASKATQSSQVGKGKGIKCSRNSDSQSSQNSGKEKSNSQENNSSDMKNDDSDKEADNDSENSKSKVSKDEGNNQKEESGSEGESDTSDDSGENSEDYNDNEFSTENEENDSDGNESSDESEDEGSSKDGDEGQLKNDSCNENSSSNDNSDKQGQEIPADVTFNGDVCNSQIDIDNIEKVIDGLIAKMARGMINKHPEAAERLLAKTQAQEIVDNQKSCHNRYRFKINTVQNSNDKSKYERAAQRLSGISRRLQKRILDVLEEQNDGGVCKNLLKGNKVNPAAAASNNGRIFKRNILPDRPELAVCVLIDQSGSMWGERIEKALEMAIIIEDFCSALDIPLQISGHCDSDGCQIYDYIRFDDYNKNRKYRLTQMFSSGCNRDGLALKYCENNILEREEDNKLLIIISDGRPNSQGYYGKVAEDDLYEIKRHFEKNGGRLVAAAIGDDKDTIKRIYKDSFMDITDLSQLPIKMIKVISSYFA
jgi:uncharacterized protein YegL